MPVIRCDNRGSARRGLAFEGWIKWRLGEVELDDQALAVQWYAQAGLADLARVGVSGWSYGGYLSAMAVCRQPYSGLFRCAVVGAPVTSWDGYDTHYTERYMGLPAENAAGYASSAVMTHAGSMPSSNRLLLVHGLIDENVHFRHTARLINALIAQRRRYDLVLFPCERHAPHKHDDRAYLEDRLAAFFDEGLRAVPVAVSVSVALPMASPVVQESRTVKHTLEQDPEQSQGQDGSESHSQKKVDVGGGASAASGAATGGTGSGMPVPPARL